MDNITGNSLLLSLGVQDQPPCKLHIQPYSSPGLQDRTRKRYDSYEVSMPLNLNEEALITHLIVKAGADCFKLFSFSEVLSRNREGLFQKMIYQRETRKEGECLIHGVGLTSAIKLNFLVQASQFRDPERSLQKAVTQTYHECVSQIEVFGYQTTTSPNASQLAPLLNIAHLLRINAREEEAVEADIVLCLCLINGRRFIQATQILKRASSYFVKKYQQSRKKESLSLKHDGFSCGSQSGLMYSASFQTSGSKKHLLRAARIQLLIADAISHPSMLHQKVEAYNKASCYFQGQTSVDEACESAGQDIYCALLKICPTLCKFLIKTLHDKNQPLKITAIRSLQFLVETLSCSIGGFIPQLMRSIITTYPTVPNRILESHYHHLLESFLTILSSLSKHILRPLFQQVLLPSLFQGELSNDLRVYLLRISEIVCHNCSADLDLGAAVLEQLFCILEGKKGLYSNLLYSATKFLQTIKSKYFGFVDGVKLRKLLDWISETLVNFAQSEITNISLSTLERLIEFIDCIFGRSRPKSIAFVAPPLNPILTFLNASLKDSKLPFEKLLDCVRTQLLFIRHSGYGEEVASEIVDKIIEKSRADSLSQKELKVLYSVLELIPVSKLDWLAAFLNCIPHSTHDQTFFIFNMLVDRLGEYELPVKILKLCIDALLDQYTVKGKAHKNSKSSFIDYLMTKCKPSGRAFSALFEYLVIGNREPCTAAAEVVPRGVRARVNAKVDSKQLARDKEMFIDKLSFSCEIASKLEHSHLQVVFQSIKSGQLKETLLSYVHSGNSKVRLKCLTLLKSVYQAWSNDSQGIWTTREVLLLASLMISVLKQLLLSYRQSKAQFNSLLLLNEVFCQLLTPLRGEAEGKLSDPEAQLEAIRGQAFTRNDIFQIRIKQLLKLWPALVIQIQSSWQNIKQAAFRFIANFFAYEPAKYRPAYFKKLIQLLSRLLKSSLNSPDSSERQGGLLITGAIVGFTTPLPACKSQAIKNFRAKSAYIKEFAGLIYQLQHDWNSYNQSLASTFVQLAVPRQRVFELAAGEAKKSIPSKRVNNFIESAYSFNLDDLGSYNAIRADQANQSGYSLSSNILHFLQDQRQERDQFQLNDVLDESCFDLVPSQQQQLDRLLVLQKLSLREIEQAVEPFAICRTMPKNLWDQRQEDHPEREEKLNNELFWNQQEEKGKEQLDFEDLGIIQVDDQQWNDYEQQVKITQKLPNKRKYKLSPNVNSPNKSQRRDFSQRKLVIDQVEASSPAPQAQSRPNSDPTLESRAKREEEKEQVEDLSASQGQILDRPKKKKQKDRGGSAKKSQKTKRKL